MRFRVERRSGVPTYLQLVRQVEQALRLGALQPGDQLPTAKAVVEETAINPNTVLKAYRELERGGLVEARPGRGTFVLRTLARPASEVDGVLRVELAGWMERAAGAGLSVEDVDALVADARARRFEGGGARA